LNPAPERATIAAVAILVSAALVSLLAQWGIAVLCRIPQHLLWLRWLRRTPPTTTSRRVAFVTDDEGRRFFLTGGRPLRLYLFRPSLATVSAAQLPCAVLCDGIPAFWIEEFHEDGYVIRDQVPGLRVEGWICCMDAQSSRQDAHQESDPSDA
jgi:hypothetical protein